MTVFSISDVVARYGPEQGIAKDSLHSGWRNQDRWRVIGGSLIVNLPIKIESHQNIRKYFNSRDENVKKLHVAAVTKN
jgi:hypothetical protein